MWHSATKRIKFMVKVDDKAILMCWVKPGNPGHGLIPGEIFVWAEQLEIMARMWMLLHCFISEGILKLLTGVGAVTVGWRGGRESRAVSFALCKYFVRASSWHEVKTGTASFTATCCTSAPSYADSGLGCVPASTPPSPNVRGYPSLVDKSSISWELVHFLCCFKGIFANIISPYSAPGTLCEYLSAIRDLLPISTALLQSLCSLSCSLAFNWL